MIYGGSCVDRSHNNAARLCTKHQIQHGWRNRSWAGLGWAGSCRDSKFSALDGISIIPRPPEAPTRAPAPVPGVKDAANLCLALFIRAVTVMLGTKHGITLHSGKICHLTWTFPKRYLRCPSTAQYSPVQPSTAQYFLVNVQVKWLILPLCTVPIVRCLLSQACLAPSSKLKNHGNFFI